MGIAFDAGHKPLLGRLHAAAAAATRVRLFAALREVGREVEPHCSICLDDLDVEVGLYKCVCVEPKRFSAARCSMETVQVESS
jgi:hypothetical protein